MFTAQKVTNAQRTFNIGFTSVRFQRNDGYLNKARSFLLR